MPHLQRSDVDDRLARINPGLFLTTLGERLKADGPDLLKRLFAIATDPDMSPRISLEAIRLISEMAGVSKVVGVIAQRLAEQALPTKTADPGASLDDADRQRYEQLASEPS
jgi:hypothetical protein